MPLRNVIKLRELLREKFPGLRTRADELPVRTGHEWTTGISRLDKQLDGGFPKSAISEVVAPRRGCGSALFLLQLLRRAATRHQFCALIDGQDSFDAAAVEQSTLSHLLWLRCRNAEEAIKTTDLVLRDGNFSVVLLDLALIPETQLRRIAAPTWYRFQRIVEGSTATFIVLTPRALISPAQVRVTLCSRFGLNAVEADQVKLTMELDFEVVGAANLSTAESLRKTA
jgi:hypothetical protein